MKTIKYLAFCFLASSIFVSCEKPDSEKEWGIALIYMPQSNYDPYIVPNSGTDAQINRNFSFDSVNMKLNVFLGVYRSGLQALESYTVNLASEPVSVDGAMILPEGQYHLPSSVTCPDGQRDATFYLEVDLGFLANNQANNYSLAVSISDPSRYELNEDLSRTEILINTTQLFGK